MYEINCVIDLSNFDDIYIFSLFFFVVLFFFRPLNKFFLSFSSFCLFFICVVVQLDFQPFETYEEINK